MFKRDDIQITPAAITDIESHRVLLLKRDHEKVEVRAIPIINDCNINAASPARLPEAAIPNIAVPYTKAPSTLRRGLLPSSKGYTHGQDTTKAAAKVLGFD